MLECLHRGDSVDGIGTFDRINRLPRRRWVPTWVRALTLVLGAVLLGACGSADPGPTDLLSTLRLQAVSEPGEDQEQPIEGLGYRLPGDPEWELLTHDLEQREAMLLAPGTIHWRAEIPPAGRLLLGLADPFGGEGTEILVRSTVEDVLHVLEVTSIPPAKNGRVEPAPWIDRSLDLSPWAGQTLDLEISVRRVGRREGNGEKLAWSMLRVASPLVTEHSPPNLLFIVVDTLRADHTTPYGYERPTTPQIAELLAAPGLVVETAYSQAPWTLPSMTSMFSSRPAGDLLGKAVGAYGIPPDVTTLGEALKTMGYSTSAFFGNPTLHRGNGFAQGFDTFYSPASLEAMRLHAESINRRALPWIHSHLDGPFAAYLHYIDPHDPYQSPDLVDGRPDFDPDYTGKVRGAWIHGIYRGAIPLENPERDQEYIRALYDDEIRHVDRKIGELLRSIPSDVLANTLIVLTADHGEELFEHGGMKHGHTLYQDQIHVPLLLRWDGHLEAGRRLEGVVRLMDLAPTVIAALGGEAPAEWQGSNLWPVFLGEKPVPRQSSYAQHFSFGPLRGGIVLGRKKLVLFNSSDSDRPEDDLQADLMAIDRRRLSRVELYDLVDDPGEQNNLFASVGGEGAAGDEVGDLAELVHRHLDASLRGLRFFTNGLEAGSRLEGELVFAEPVPGWLPLFLGPEDEVEIDGPRVRFRLHGEDLEKGLILDLVDLADQGGDSGWRLESASLRLDGVPLGTERLRVADGQPWNGEPVRPAAVLAAAFPARSDRPGARLWIPAASLRVEPDIDPETLERLRALGYIQ